MMFRGNIQQPVSRGRDEIGIYLSRVSRLVKLLFLIHISRDWDWKRRGKFKYLVL
jgi:hypothetical protein